MILSDSDGTPEVVDEPAWVLVYILDDDGTAFQYHAALVPDPCSNAPTPTTIVFPYDRQASSLYAGTHSYQNDSFACDDLTVCTGGPGTHVGSLATRRLSNLSSSMRLPYAYFLYSTDRLQHGVNGKTASAIFISQSIWVGGMPMTVDSSGNRNCSISNNHITSGWRYCGQDSSMGIPVPGDVPIAWRLHDGIVTYYTTSATTTSLGPGNDILGVDQGYKAGEFAYIDGLKPYLPCISCGGPDSNTNSTWDPNGLSDWFRQELEIYGATISAGDYVWINTGDTSQNPTIHHGLYVVGWGPIGDYYLDPMTGTITPIGKPQPNGTVEIQISCPTVIDLDFAIEGAGAVFTGQHPLTLYNSRPNNDEIYWVPYIVDFLGTVGARPQSPKPRPFFCTRQINKLPLPSDTGFAVHQWHMYRLSSKVSIEPNQLFVSSEFQWSSQSGQTGCQSGSCSVIPTP